MKRSLTYFLSAGLLICTAMNAAGQAATVSTNPAGNVSYNQANLNGYVTAGAESVNLSFQWGTTTAYGSTANATPATSQGGSSTQFNATLTAIVPNTIYHYRAVASNTTATVYGSDMTFTTQQLSAPSIYSSGILHGPGDLFATFFADINSNNSATTISFEYGTTTAYGQSATPSPTSLAAGAGSSFAVSINSLLPNVTYYYRWVAQNSLGVTYSRDGSFNTVPVSSVSGIAASGIHIYPNPASDRLFIDMLDGSNNPTIRLTDLMGKTVQVPVVKNNLQYQLDLSGLVYGAYTVFIINNSNSYSHVVVKK